MRAVVVSEVGGPDVLRVEDVPAPEPGPGEVRVRVHAAGGNYIDTYHRTGRYALPLPTGLGQEGAGVVEAVGGDVRDLAVGDQVAWSGVLGSYAEQVVVPAAVAVPVPDGISTQVAAAALLQGMTAHYLVRSTFPLAEGHTALVHAASGGTGRLLVQLAKRCGARVIATCSTEDKAALARAAGADEAIRYDEEDFAEALAARGEVVDVVYDGVGRATFERGLACLRPRGTMVLFGQASGAVEPVDPQRLSQGGSLFLTRPTLAHYVRTPEELRWRAGEVFDAITGGELEVRIDRTWPLEEAAEAHRYLEARRTRGKLLLEP